MCDFLDYMKSISDEDLLTAFEECQSCRETGILSFGKARSIIKKWAELSGNSNFSVNFIMNEVSNEMARRYYRLKMSK